MLRYSIVVGIVGTWVALLGGQSQPSVFRIAADAVAVNVSVKRGNIPTLGLAAEDFRLFDNNVPQRVAAVSMDAVPVDVSFVLGLGPDISTFVAWDVETPRDAVRRMATFLRPTDRFRVLTMGNSVVTAVPWQLAGPLDTSKIQYAPSYLVADSVFVALLHRADPDRRHLVVALTDGLGRCSLASGESLRRAAERSGAVFHWVDVRHGPPKKAVFYAGPGAQGVGSTCPSASLVDYERFLSDAARLTGGNVYTAWSKADVAGSSTFFDAILDDFRRSYILHYVPEGVSRTGWHRLRVEVQPKGLTVRARTGYWGTAAASGVPPPASQSR
jgi:VWFA-related protein